MRIEHEQIQRVNGVISDDLYLVPYVSSKVEAWIQMAYWGLSSGLFVCKASTLLEKVASLEVTVLSFSLPFF